MVSRPLSPDVTLSIDLSAVMSRHSYTRDPGPVIAELRQTAGDRMDLLAEEVGLWIGFHDAPDTHVLAEALRVAFADLDLEPHIALGESRRYAPRHGTAGYSSQSPA